MDIGPVELVLVVVIIAMLFGVGKLPEVFGAVGKGIREFRREMAPETTKSSSKEEKKLTTDELPSPKSE